MTKELIDTAKFSISQATVWILRIALSVCAFVLADSYLRLERQHHKTVDQLEKHGDLIQKLHHIMYEKVDLMKTSMHSIEIKVARMEAEMRQTNYTRQHEK